MIWYQIILLILGIVIFVLSFILPEKAGAGFDKKNTEDDIKKILDEEVKKAVSKLEMQADEKMEDAIERTTRSLERISNDKIMAVNEYSDTVLKDINKNHEEVMFLYSMLDDKHKQLKETVVGMEQTTKSVQSSLNEMVLLRNSTDEILRTQYGQAQNIVQNADTEKKEFMKEQEMNHLVAEDMSVSVENASVKTDDNDNSIEELVSALEEFSQQPVKRDKNPASKATGNKRGKSKTAKNVNTLPQIQSRDAKGNHNEAVLKLHAEGKSNVAIAKELGLGVGEVKLVIDLFRQS